VATLTQLTAEQFLRYEPPAGPIELRHELVHGQVIEMPPPGARHGSVQSSTAYAMIDAARLSSSGWVLTDAGFVIQRDPDTVRAPDVAFVRAERLSRGLPAGYIEGPPDLAVEIRSPSDGPRRVAEAVADYLAAGTPVVWVIDPAARTLTVHRPRRAPLVKSSIDEVSLAALAPGRAVRVATLLSVMSA
jgi:Uma2 family endonuclease